MITFKQFITETDEVHAKKLGDLPEWTPSLSEGSYSMHGVPFSSEHGLGAVPFNRSVDYHGFVVLLKPSMFLRLALPHTEERHQAAKEIVRLVKEGYPLGPPFLDILLPHDDDPVRVKSHEGRGRMLAVQQLAGDLPVPVHCILRGGDRTRDITEDHIKAMKNFVMSEDGKRVNEPFEAIFVAGTKR